METVETAIRNFLRPRRRTAQGAFTLIELLVVIVIIGILVGIITGAVQSVQHQRKVAQAKTEVQAIATAVEEYFRTYGEFPISTNWYHAVNPWDGERSDCFFAPGVWASTMPPTGGAPYQSGPRPDNYAMAREFHNRLMGSNEQGKVFLTIVRIEGVNSANGVLLDPWKTPYDFYLDSNYSGEIHFYSYGGGLAEFAIRKNCMSFIRCRGPNRQVDSVSTTRGDDITWPPLDSL